MTKKYITIEVDDELSAAIASLAIAAVEDDGFGSLPAGRLARVLWDALTEAPTIDT